MRLCRSVCLLSETEILTCLEILLSAKESDETNLQSCDCVGLSGSRGTRRAWVRSSWRDSRWTTKMRQPELGESSVGDKIIPIVSTVGVYLSWRELTR